MQLDKHQTFQLLNALNEVDLGTVQNLLIEEKDNDIKLLFIHQPEEFLLEEE